jgi:pimeloyl-ACP methyl ester carboxylesterase
MLMRTRSSSSSSRLWLVASLLGANACVRAARSDAPASTLPGSHALVLKDQGSFAVGGTVVTSSSAVSALFDRIGPGILVTHSQGGGPGWLTAMKNPNVRAVVSYEPGSGFVFPEGEVPPAMPCLTGPLEGVGVPLSQFMRLTKIPIVLYFGDNIPEEPSKNPGQDNWRVRITMARMWRDAVNRHGGDVTLVHLPDLGIRGNTHFMFSDLNNLQIATCSRASSPRSIWIEKARTARGAGARRI